MKKIPFLLIFLLLTFIGRGQLTITVPTIAATPGQTVNVPVKLYGASSTGIPISSANINIVYDTAKLTYVNTVNFYSGTPVGEWFFSGNYNPTVPCTAFTASANWMQPSLMTLGIPDGTTLYEVQFLCKQGNCPLTFCINEFTDVAFNLIPTTATDGGINMIPAALSGPTAICLGAMGSVYTTDPGKTGYVWNVVGGTITAGGTSTNNTATVTWNTAGSQSITVSYTGTPSNTLPVSVTAPPTASVSVAASTNPVCAGLTVTFTATPTNGGLTPVYQWKKNGTNVGTNNASFTFTPVNNDLITCVMTSSLSCVTGSPATSGAVTMTVNPLTASISIAASATNVTAGTPVTFTATPVNGGAAPSYQWKVNSNSAGTNSPIFIYTPSNGDVVFCILSSNAPCITSMFTSNLVTITVTDPPVTPLMVTVSTKTAIPGQKVFFPVKIKGASATGAPISSANIQLTYDPAVLAYDTLINFYAATPNAQWFFSGNSNTVAANWIEPNLLALAIPDSTTLFEIRFTYIGGTATLPFTVNEFTDASYNMLPANHVNGGIGPISPMAGYFSCDFHQHTTYTDGSYSFAHVMQKNNQFGLTWWANSEHGGGFNRDATSSGLDLGGTTVYFDSYVPNPIIGTYNVSGGHQNMWRWQSLRDYSFQNTIAARGTYSSNMILQSYELNVPGHEHAGVGIVNNQFNANPNCNPLAEFEFKFDASDADITGGAAQGWTKSALANGHSKAVEAVTWLHNNYPNTSYMVTAHAERKSLNNIQGFRDLNNAGPDVCFGFESMPGHQKATDRGEYKTSYNTTGTSTYGGTGIYSARIGGLWDAMLSEGRKWWLFASSDFHSTDADFYPGEYQKTYAYVANRANPQSYIDALRSGNSFVVEGDLIDSLQFKVGNTAAMPMYATMGQTFTTTQTAVVIKIRIHDPEGTNNNTYSAYNNPSVNHFDLIKGKVGSFVTPDSPKYSVDTINTTSVIARFDAVGGVASPNGITSIAWTDLGSGWKEINYTYTGLADSVYFRVRGTNQGLNVANETDANGNPLSDALMAPNNATKAFADLWFYANPVFVAGPNTPLLTGPATVCQGSAGNVYTTDAGKSNYAWTVTGGTITSGGTSTDNTVTVSWPASGSRSVSVSYLNSALANLQVAVTAPAAASVSIAATSTTICANTPVTFTATPVNGGTTPVYQWKKNGANAGANSPTYTYNPANNDAITCVMTSSLTCVTGTPAISNSISMTVNPIAVVTLSISPSANPVIAGTTVTFTANPVNGGLTPSFQWKVNGMNAGTNSSTFAFVPVNGDAVYCLVTSSAGCASGIATSNIVTMVVNIPAAPPIQVTLSTKNAIPGQKVFFPVKVKGASSSGTPISSANLQISYNPAILSYDTLVNFYAGTPGSQWFFSGNSNTVAANWIEPNLLALAIPDSATLFEIQFTYIGGSTALPYTVNEFTDASYNLLSATHVDGGVNPVSPLTGYFACDFHQHTTYTDGSYSFAHVMQKNNQFGLAWWANSEHGGAFNRDATSSGLDLGGATVYFDSYTPNPIIGTYNASGGHQNMWRWQSLRDYSFQNTQTARGAYSANMIFQSYELNVPGHEHAGLGIINNQFSANPNCNPLAEFEFKFDASDADVTGGAAQGWTKSALSNGHSKAVEAVTWLHNNYPNTSYMITAHAERKSLNNIQGFRDMNTAGPDVCFGFESMPGHQKAADRGEYKTSYNTAGTSTYGGTGIYSAKIGGLWDAMLSEGRKWWLFASSDFHSTDADFYPGEYQKTYAFVANRANPQSYIDALRSGNSFVVEGDLIDSLDFRIGNTAAMPVYATMGQTFTTTQTSVVVKIKVRDPQGTNNNTYSTYNNPLVNHIDLIKGKVRGMVTPADPRYTVDTVMTTNVIARFDAVGGVTSPDGITSMAWTDLGNGVKEVNYTYNGLADSVYFRIRGTNQGLNVTNETDANGNPLSDALMAPNNATKAFADLWFYANPVFVAGPKTPLLTGPATVCQGSVGNVYTTDAGKSNYSWVVTGGNITSGGTSSSNTVTVQWTSVGAQTISISYTGSILRTLSVNVNALPVPTVTGTASVCAGTTNVTYTTESSMTGYNWTISPGGNITAGTGTSAVSVTWNTPGAQTVSVNYTNANGCTAASPTLKNVTVNALPVPTVTGLASVCTGTAGVIYSTETSMTGYTWTVSAGGTITAGAGTNAITVTWNSAGAQTVSVNYNNSAGCSAVAATVKSVTVNALPTPSVSGPASVCAPVTGVSYSTQAGMTGYTWTVSAGGSITAGAGTNTITVTWTTTGAQSVTVNYTNTGGCQAAASTIYPVTVNPRPTPTIAGPATSCDATPGVIYTTQAGMTGYVWTVSVGGTITAGAGTNTITVTWNTAGAQNVAVNYNNISGCLAQSATVFNVTVNARPAPVISGPASVCINTTNNVYSTQAGMTGYVWTVSAGGSITAGAGTSTITVTWSSAGAQQVTANYTSGSGCSANTATVYNVTVNYMPAPTISGSGNLCVNSGYYNYVTESGMTGYVWTVSTGGTITWGAGTNQIQVAWNNAGNQSVSVNYSNLSGCTPAAPTTLNVTVNPMPGNAGSITGSTAVCGGTQGVAYSVAPIINALTYVWTLPAGATIGSGAGTNNITVNYAGYANSGNVSVYGNNLCGNGIASSLAVTITQLPAAAGTITGNASVCQMTNGETYSVGNIANATAYNWTVPSGATIVSGVNTNSIIVDFGANAVSGNITVFGSNSCGNGTLSPAFVVTVNSIPATPVAVTTGDSVGSSAQQGNQWYYSATQNGTGAIIPGATGQVYSATQTGWYWTVVTLNGCPSEPSNRVYVLMVGLEELEAGTVNIYPVPNDGKFTVSISSHLSQRFSISVYTDLGVQIYELRDLLVQGHREQSIDLRPVPSGVYIVVIRSADSYALKKIVVKH